MTSAKNILTNCTLYAIIDTGYVETKDLESTLQRLISSGASVVQFRAKNISPEETLTLARPLREICLKASVLFAVNDYPNIAKELDADILHIGQEDGCIAKVRKKVSKKCLIGRSTHSIEQAKNALAEGFDYIGYGPLFPTQTKPGRAEIGLENIQFIEQVIGSQIPVFCIGGIKLENLDRVIDSGGRRIVIVSELLLSADMNKYMKQIRVKLDKMLKQGE